MNGGEGTKRSPLFQALWRGGSVGHKVRVLEIPPVKPEQDVLGSVLHGVMDDGSLDALACARRSGMGIVSCKYDINKFDRTAYTEKTRCKSSSRKNADIECTDRYLRPVMDGYHVCCVLSDTSWTKAYTNPSAAASRL